MQATKAEVTTVQVAPPAERSTVRFVSLLALSIQARSTAELDTADAVNPEAVPPALSEVAGHYRGIG